MIIRIVVGYFLCQAIVVHTAYIIKLLENVLHLVKKKMCCQLLALTNATHATMFIFWVKLLVAILKLHSLLSIFVLSFDFFSEYVL